MRFLGGASGFLGLSGMARKISWTENDRSLMCLTSFATFRSQVEAILFAASSLWWKLWTQHLFDLGLIAITHHFVEARPGNTGRGRLPTLTYASAIDSSLAAGIEPATLTRFTSPYKSWFEGGQEHAASLY